MACIVHIETATDVCSVALSENGAILTSKENYDGPNHNVLLAPYVDEMVSFADSHAIPIDAVAVSCGPGSYTGLRIGVSTAKGLCYGRNLKLVSVSTLQLLCVPLLLHDNDIPEDALLCPMLDARRMEVYSAIYDRSLHTVKDISADIIDECSYKEILDKQPVAFLRGFKRRRVPQRFSHGRLHVVMGVQKDGRFIWTREAFRIDARTPTRRH